MIVTTHAKTVAERPHEHREARKTREDGGTDSGEHSKQHRENGALRGQISSLTSQGRSY